MLRRILLRGRKREKSSLSSYLAYGGVSLTFLPSFHLCSRLGIETFRTFARDFPRDYPVLLRRLLDVLVRDGGFKSTIFQRDVWRITHVFVRAYVYMCSVKSTFRAAP